jgi:ADP-ribose pyrophosphatase YjhB (NUDIX family)
MRAALPLLKLRGGLRPISLGVQALVRDAEGRILLVRPTYVPGWHFPGGGVEPGETAEAALRRELAEEGGVELTGQPRLVGLYHNPGWTRGDHVAFYDAGPWRCCRRRWGVEIDAAVFFDPTRLPDGVAPGVLNRLAEAAGAPQSLVW